MLLEHTDHFGAALAAADLAVSRAGGTVWELAAAGTPSVLVPYPHATADHQTLNARHFERGGGAVVVADDELDRVPALVDDLLSDPERLAAMRASMLALARPDAADVIADELVALARRRGLSRGGTTPLEGRRLYFVGIGGSGMSAYANIARAWGAEVRRLGRGRDDLHEDARRGRARPRRRAASTRRVRGGGVDRPPRPDRRDLRAPRSSPSSSRRATRSSSPARTARPRRRG